MRVTRNSLFVTTVLVAGITSWALAQGGGRAQRFYDPSTETTVKGTVEKVMEVTGKRGWNGTHLTFRTNDQTYDVHVGPSDYVSKNGFKFSAGDRVEVTGSKIKLGGVDTIVAREIKRDGKVLTLRDSQGIPKWSGGGRRFY
jgi:hypothetical protein